MNSENNIMHYLTNGKTIYNIYNQFDDQKELMDLYNNFLDLNTDKEINKNYSFGVFKVKVTDSMVAALKNQNEYMEFNFSEDAINSGAYIDIILPNFRNKRYRDAGRKINGREFVFLIPKGGQDEGQYALAKGIVNFSKSSIPKEDWMFMPLDSKLEIDKIEITDKVLLGPSATSIKTNNFSYNINVLSSNMTSNMQEMRSSNVEKALGRIYEYNKAIFFGGHSDIDLVNVSLTENKINSSTMLLSDLSNTTNVDFGASLLRGGKLNQHSNDFYMSGKELRSIIQDGPVADSIKDELIYRPDFDLKKEFFKSLRVYDSDGKFNQQLTDEIAQTIKDNKFSKKISRTKFAELVGYSLANQRQVLTSQQVVDYNKSLSSMFSDVTTQRKRFINRRMLNEAIKERRQQFFDRIDSYEKMLLLEQNALNLSENESDFIKNVPDANLADHSDHVKKLKARIRVLNEKLRINREALDLTDEELLNLDDEEFLSAQIDMIKDNAGSNFKDRYKPSDPKGRFGINLKTREGFKVYGTQKERMEAWENASIGENREFLSKIGLLNNEERKAAYMTLDEADEIALNSEFFKRQNELKNQIITDFKYNLLKDYGFVERLTKDGEVDVAKDVMINRFYEYYNKLETVNSDMLKIKDRLDNTLDEGALLGQIMSGRIFDNYTAVGKQNDVKGSRARSVFATDFSLFGYMEQHNQRAGQSADKFTKAVVNSNGESINISKMFNGFYSSIDEMKYKKHQFEYEQEKQLIRKLAPKLNLTGEQVEQMPNLLQNQVKVLYANTEGAFLDSNLFTKSFALQNISMQDNKQPFVIKYSSLRGSNAFRKADGTYYSSGEIEDFFKVISSNAELNDDQKIMQEVMLTNLLGRENYEKYSQFKKGTFKRDIEEIGDIIRRTQSIGESEAGYVANQEEVIKSFNALTNKYFIPADAEARIQVVRNNMLISGAKTGVKGSNFGLIEDISYTPEGIQLNLKQLLLETEGAKGMLNNSKHTARYTNLIKVVSGDSHYYVEGLMNGLYNKNSRGNFGAFLSMSLTTMVSNALQANLANGTDMVNGKIDYQARLDNFLKSMGKVDLSNSGIKGSGNFKNIDLLDLLNIDISLKGGQVIFTDKNAREAINNFDPNSPVGLHSVIIENMNNNLAKKLGRTGTSFTEEEAAAFGYYLMNSLYENYEGAYTNTIAQSSRSNLRIRVQDAAIYNSYLTKNFNDPAGALVPKMNLLDNTKGVSYLFNVFPSMMYEAKSRSSEDALKVGRLSTMVLKEAGFSEVSDSLFNKAVAENLKMGNELQGLVAEKDTPYARGTAFFNNLFGKNVINLADEGSLDYSVSDEVDDYLAKSPLGKMIVASGFFDEKRKALKRGKSIKGLLTGLDSELMRKLQIFYDTKNEAKVMFNIGGMAADSIFYKLLDPNDSVIASIFKSEKLNDQNEDIDLIGYKKEISRLIKESGVNGELDIRDAIRNIRLSEDGRVASGINDFMVSAYDSVIRKVNAGDYQAGKYVDKDTLLRIVEKLKYLDYENMNKDNVTKSLNIFKSFISFAEGYKKAIGGKNSTLFYGLSQYAQEDLLNFNLTRDAINSIVNFNSKDSGEFANIIASFFSDFGLFNRSNLLNISELSEISKFKNVPFLIDSFSIDDNGRNIATASIQSVERIIKSANELKELRIQRDKVLPTLMDSDLVRGIAKAGAKYSHKYYKDYNENYVMKKAYNASVNDTFDEIGKSSIFTEYDKADSRIIKSETRKKLHAFKESIGKLKNDWYGATHFNYIYDSSKTSDDFLFDVIKGLNSSAVNSIIDQRFLSFKDDIVNKRGSYNILEFILLNNREDMSTNMFNYLNNTLKNDFNPLDFVALDKILKNNNFGFIETYDEIENLIKVNRGRGDNYIPILKEIRDFLKQQGISAIRDEFKNYQNIIENAQLTFENIEYYKDIKNFDAIQSNFVNLTSNPVEAKAYFDLIVGIQTKADMARGKIDNSILAAERKLISNLVGRTNGILEELFGENGRMKDLSNVFVKTSAAFSPIYAGGVEQAVANEIASIANEKDLKILSKRKDDLYRSLHLIYGDEISADIVQDLKGRFKANNFDENYYSELKKKLSLFTNIVVGDRQMYKKTGQIGGFGKRQYTYQMLSRHPHQYRSSISPTRYVMLNREDLGRSFIASIFGNGTKFGESFQSNLYFIGKRTSLAANGDFDGDTFQLLFLGNRDFQYDEYAKKISKLESKKLEDLYKKKVKLYFLLNNVAGENLKENIKKDGLKYRTIKKLIKDIAYGGKDYDENGNFITDDDLYKHIEIDYLGISHEKIRVMNKVSKEQLDHSILPNFKGNLKVELDNGSDLKISKKIAAMATIFTDGNLKTKLYDGTLTEEEFVNFIDNIMSLDETQKKELHRIANPEILKKVINKLKEDKGIIKAQNLLYSDTKYLEMAGIANTGEVHHKLTKFRATVSGLLSEKDINNYINGIKKSMSVADSTELINDMFEGKTQKEFVSILNKFTRAIAATNDIGTLIETLAISSKKGRSEDTGRILSLMESLAEDVRNKKGVVRMNYSEVTNFLTMAMEAGSIDNVEGKEVPYKNLKINLDAFLEQHIKGYRDRGYKDGGVGMTEMQKKIREFFILVSGGNLKQLENQEATLEDIFEDGISTSKLAQTISTVSYSIFGGEAQFFSGGKRNTASGNLDAILKKANSVRGYVSEILSPIIENVKNATKFIPDLSDHARAFFRTFDISKKGAEQVNSAKILELDRKAEQILNGNITKTEEVSEAAEIAVKSNVDEFDEYTEAMEAIFKSQVDDNAAANLELEKKGKAAMDLLEEYRKAYATAADTAKKDEIIRNLEKKITQLSDELSRTKKAAQQAAETVAENGEAAGKVVKKAMKFKKLGPYAIGAAAMAVFFSIFQRSRPVVNLDINEKQYEDSKGSVYRNLGQYTMNTNIRSLY